MSDVAAHYAALLNAEVLPSEAFCLTAVRGVTIEEALTRFDASLETRPATLAEAGKAAMTAYPDDLPVITASEVGGWVFLAADNGWHGAMPEVLTRLSAGTVATTAYWNVNLNNTLALAEDGRLSEMDFVLDDEPPEELAGHVAGLDFEGDDLCGSALAFVERVTGVRLDEDWARTPWPTAVISSPLRFESSGPTGWLQGNAPELLEGFAGADEEVLREVAALAADRACAATGVEDRQASVHGTHLQALNLRWDRCGPVPSGADPAAERLLVSRAHALAAVRACEHGDPFTAAAQALINACQADREHWPELRELVAR
ncbi:DUF6461 domain-containing protein [Lentzea sp. NBRC 102530]|uniref:DUF6461 domain-containing protein n=1 Tax=Lentzea sp. NBRC 102530 TaxID=3032201 RepID=UPI00249FD28E|nr:DUF6461 domain-containing protein [Lentzea sp. NBRC 102530]GLY50465.1 hypothetical protein Lesp01_41210 [Lentzea sp. NBRC 102530]